MTPTQWRYSAWIAVAFSLSPACSLVVGRDDLQDANALHGTGAMGALGGLGGSTTAKPDEPGSGGEAPNETGGVGGLGGAGNDESRLVRVYLGSKNEIFDSGSVLVLDEDLTPLDAFLVEDDQGVVIEVDDEVGGIVGLHVSDRNVGVLLLDIPMMDEVYLPVRRYSNQEETMTVELTLPDDEVSWVISHDCGQGENPKQFSGTSIAYTVACPPDTTEFDLNIVAIQPNEHGDQVNVGFASPGAVFLPGSTLSVPVTDLSVLEELEVDLDAWPVGTDYAVVSITGGKNGKEHSVSSAWFSVASPLVATHRPDPHDWWRLLVQTIGSGQTVRSAVRRSTDLTSFEGTFFNVLRLKEPIDGDVSLEGGRAKLGWALSTEGSHGDMMRVSLRWSNSMLDVYSHAEESGTLLLPDPTDLSGDLYPWTPGKGDGVSYGYVHRDYLSLGYDDFFDGTVTEEELSNRDEVSFSSTAPL